MLLNSQHAFSIRAFDSIILVESADAEIHALLNRYIYPPLPRTESTQISPDSHLVVDREDGRFRLSVDGKLSSIEDSPHGAALAAVKALDDVVVQRLRRFRAVHAGAVCIDGKTLLLPGTSHAGKSSLVAELLRRGASHFSDEYALVDQEGLIHSYPRPLLLRNGRPTQSLVLPEELNARFAEKPAPVGWIFALDYVPGGRWDVPNISQSEAVMILLSNTPHEMGSSPDVVEFFLRIASNAKCIEGTRGEVEEAASFVMDIIRGK